MGKGPFLINKLASLVGVIWEATCIPSGEEVDNSAFLVDAEAEAEAEAEAGGAMDSSDSGG